MTESRGFDSIPGMAAPVNILRVVGPSAKGAEDVRLRVDDAALEDLLSAAFERVAGKPWAEARDVKVVLPALFRSAESPGAHEILTCSGCEMATDLGLEPFEVSHEGDLVRWTVKVPWNEVFHETGETISFRFHRPQLEKALSKLRTGA